ncbi:MAG: hypothetical protein II949_13675 [Prevotella sp.]|nr:hypothetical protein [Prevotella sp.]
MKRIIIYFFPIILVGCTAPENPIEYEFSHNDFSKTIGLKGEKIELSDMLNPDDMFLVSDSMIIASNDDPAQRDKVQLFSLQTGHRISSFGAKGHARNELVSCDIIIPFSVSDTFYIDDFTQSRYWVCSVDSLKNGRSPICATSDYSRDVITILPEDTTYIGFNFWYLNDSDYDNGINKAIERYDTGVPNERNRSTEYNYFVANVTGAVMVRNPHNDDVWVAYNHDNLIEIYDKSLELKRRMKGPEKARKQYVTTPVKNKKFVSFGKDMHVGCYYAAIATNSHVYFLYRNINDAPFPIKPQPVEILKIDWNGRLVCNYKLDRYAYCISVDSKEENLYGACVDSESGATELVKFKLK